MALFALTISYRDLRREIAVEIARLQR